MTDTPARPYRFTPIFDEMTLPAALRQDHRTKAGVWGVIRVLGGELRLTFSDTGEVHVLSPGKSGLVRPQETHFVEPLGAMQMQVDFFDQLPEL